MTAPQSKRAYLAMADRLLDAAAHIKTWAIGYQEVGLVSARDISELIKEHRPVHATYSKDLTEVAGGLRSYIIVAGQKRPQRDNPVPRQLLCLTVIRAFAKLRIHPQVLMRTNRIWARGEMRMEKNRKFILSVEDDPDTQEMLGVLVKQRGYYFQAVDNCADALRLIRDSDPAAVLLDNLLPDGNGIELCRQVRQFNKKVPIIFLSGSGFGLNRKRRWNRAQTFFSPSP